MFVAKANPIVPALLPAPSCAPVRGRRRGRQSTPAPSPAPRGNPIAGVRMACALRVRAKRAGLGETFANQYSLGPNPFNAVFSQIEPTLDWQSGKIDVGTITNNPTTTSQKSQGGGTGTKPTDKSGQPGGGPGVTLIPNDRGSGSGLGLPNNQKNCFWGTDTDGNCKSVPWWAWALAGSAGFLLVMAAVRK